MPVREEPINIPIELLRTVVEIVEAGGFTRAATRLGISQPGVSAQIKRLQVLVGGQVFDRSATGILLTERGKTLLPLARQILEANDQILRVGGTARDGTPARVGTSALYARRIVEAVADVNAVGVIVLCDESDETAKGLQDGYIDIACMVKAQMGNERLLARWDEELIWVRARDFVLSPSSPIPLVGMPNHLQDRIAVAALRQAERPYRHVFVAADLTARLAAVASGMGVMPMTARCFRGDLVVANEYYLPPLGKVEAGICLQEHADPARLAPLLDRLVCALKPAARGQAQSRLPPMSPRESRPDNGPVLRAALEAEER